MQRNIKEIAREVEQKALQAGYTSIEPDASLIQIHTNKDFPHHLDFTLRKGNNYAGNFSIVVTNSNVKNQTVEQLDEIIF